MNKIYTEIKGLVLVILATVILTGCNTSNDVVIMAAPTYCVAGGSSCGHAYNYHVSSGSCYCPEPYSNSHSTFHSCCYRQGTYPVYNQDSAAMVSTGSYYYQYHR
jgi:hypothetical protein